MRDRLVVLLAATVLVAGCSSDEVSSPSPSETPPRHRAQCVVADAQGQVIVQPGALSAERSLVLHDVALQHPVNLTIVDREVVAYAGNPVVQGVIRNYPPLRHADLADGLAHWSQRRALRGLRVTPDDGQQAVLVALQLTDPSREGHLDGVDLTADDGVRAWPQPLLVEPHRDLTLCTVAESASTLDWVPAPTG